MLLFFSSDGDTSLSPLRTSPLPVLVFTNRSFSVLCLQRYVKCHLLYITFCPNLLKPLPSLLPPRLTSLCLRSPSQQHVLHFYFRPKGLPNFPQGQGYTAFLLQREEMDLCLGHRFFSQHYGKEAAAAFEG